VPHIRVPTPLRLYTEGQKDVEVSGDTVASALHDLMERFPSLRPHLYDEGDTLRSFVHVFLGDRDIRDLSADGTRLQADDRLLIVPSIAGGAAPPRRVDHNALRVNQGMIIALLGAAFVTDTFWVAAGVGLVMLIGSAVGRPGFLPVYRLLRRTPWLHPDVYEDRPEPHRFAQTLGGVVLAAATFAFLAGLPVAGWALAWVVIALAGLNLFGGFCLGCAVYYWLARLKVPGFTHLPPDGALPGRRPIQRA
jgi:molybdopterin converting factor small subunit